MDQEFQSVLLPLVRAFRIQQEHLLKLEAAIRALQIALAEATRSDPQALLRSLASVEKQLRHAEPTRAAREQVDAIVRVLEQHSPHEPVDA